MFSSYISSSAPRPCRAIASRARVRRHCRTAGQLMPSFQSVLTPPNASFIATPNFARARPVAGQGLPSAGMTGSSRYDSRPGPVHSVCVLPASSGGRSAGSSCRNGPQPVISFLNEPSRGAPG